MLELKETENNMLWIRKALLAIEVFFLYPLKVEGNAAEWNKIMAGAKDIAISDTYHTILVNTSKSTCELDLFS